MAMVLLETSLASGLDPLPIEETAFRRQGTLNR
jgi:hypothetical protein